MLSDLVTWDGLIHSGCSLCVAQRTVITTQAAETCGFNANQENINDDANR
jgi:hypothetical protein